MSVLPQKQFDLLTKIMNNKKVFDKHDNCVQDSVRNVSGVLGASYSQVQRLFRDMRIEGLMSPAVDIYGVERLMVNPAFLYFHTFHDKRFHRAMYVLGGHEEAVEWLKLCRLHGRLYNPSTGEDIGVFNTDDDLAYAGSYSREDRDKIHQRDGYKELPAEAEGELSPSMADVLDVGGWDREFDERLYKEWKEEQELARAKGADYA